MSRDDIGSLSRRTWDITRFKRCLAWLSGPYMALLVLLIVCSLSSEHFRSVQNLLNITRQVSYSGIIALGMTFVIVGGGIDLSVGSLLALSGVFSILAMNQVQGGTVGILIAGLVALLSGLAGGALNGLLVTLGRIPPFIATLGTLSLYRSLALYFADAGMVASRNDLYRDFGGSFLLGIPTPVLIMLLLTLVMGGVMTRTSFGRHVCALGANARVAAFAGIRTGLVGFCTYLIAGGAAGISAMLFGGRLGSVSSTSAGLSYELDAIAAVIIGGASMSGGRGSLWGTLAGVLILGVVSNALDMWGVSVNLQGAVKGLVIIIAVFIQRKERS